MSSAGAMVLGFRYRFSTTSLSPYGMSFWVLILAACGGGGGGIGLVASNTPEPSNTPKPSTTQTVQKSGHVHDGPMWRAGVYLDVSDNGELDRGTDHFVGETNGQGAFSGSAPQQHKGKRYIVDLNDAIDIGNDGAVGENVDRALSRTWLAP